VTVEQAILSVKTDDTNHLKQRLRDTVEFATPDILTWVWQEFEY